MSKKQSLKDEAGVGEYTPGSWFKCSNREIMREFFNSRLPAIREAAKECGYAIGVHGSEMRDFDLMAMPWRDDPASISSLARAIQGAACGITQSSYQFEEKPCGRFAVSMPICWVETDDHTIKSLGHIDLSVMKATAQSGAGVDASQEDPMLLRVLNFISYAESLKIGGADGDAKLEREDIRDKAKALYADLKAIRWGAKKPEQNADSEWFFRWIARGKGGHTPMEQAIEMIWHSPDNPYAENNPWQTHPETEGA